MLCRRGLTRDIRAPRGERPTSLDASRPLARQQDNAPVGAPPTPRVGGERKVHDPGANAPRERDGLRDWAV